jgi:hypothetical protein
VDFAIPVVEEATGDGDLGQDTGGGVDVADGGEVPDGDLGGGLGQDTIGSGDEAVFEPADSAGDTVFAPIDDGGGGDTVYAPTDYAGADTVDAPIDAGGDSVYAPLETESFSPDAALETVAEE